MLVDAQVPRVDRVTPRTHTCTLAVMMRMTSVMCDEWFFTSEARMEPHHIELSLLRRLAAIQWQISMMQR